MSLRKKGVFITFEGPDGSGKSTQMRLLARKLAAQGVKNLTTREPGGGRKNSLPEKIRELLLRPGQTRVTAGTELFLFLAARAQHVHDLILPQLRAGRVVLCERFSDATFAYQVGGRRLPARFVAEANRLATGGLKPNLTLLLDLPAEAGLKRAARTRPGLDRIESESLAFHRGVRRAYLRLARSEPRRFRVVAAGAPPEKVAASIWRAVAPRVKG